MEHDKMKLTPLKKRFIDEMHTLSGSNLLFVPAITTLLVFVGVFGMTTPYGAFLWPWGPLFFITMFLLREKAWKMCERYNYWPEQD